MSEGGHGHSHRPAEVALLVRRALRVVQTAQGLARGEESGSPTRPGALESLLVDLGLRDLDTLVHAGRCAWLATAVAQALPLSPRFTWVVRAAAVLHDLGKLWVPPSVLLKPGPLTERQWQLMRRHPELGGDVLSSLPGLAEVRDAVLHHHERYDGRGYPHGLRRDEIPLAARVLAVTDAFDAMTTDRPYRRAMPPEQAVRELVRHAGSQFDPDVVDVFLQVLRRETPPWWEGRWPVLP
ncbi:MAG TPA: HD-GYP domain-containing protein [Dehalococcoidia bacterium]|nr:HD-GYP domain-containing protein [Dehalococcoidia bacterium]